MSALDKELEQLKSDIISDTLGLVEKYVSITSLDIPENDEDEAKKRVIEIIKSALAETEDK